MKKLLLSLTLLIVLTGCDMNLGNTPTKKVEEYFEKYQKLDNEVLEDLDKVLNLETSIDDETRNDYKKLYKNHYKNLEYEIKNETIDGKNATVETQITVNDYTKIINEINNQKIDNSNQFNDEDGNYSTSAFNKYRLDKIKDTKEKITYTLYLTLTKDEKGKWKLNQLNKDELNKINGLYSE